MEADNLIAQVFIKLVQALYGWRFFRLQLYLDFRKQQLIALTKL
jgi:hypothetical protein